MTILPKKKISSQQNCSDNEAKDGGNNIHHGGPLGHQQIPPNLPSHLQVRILIINLFIIYYVRRYVEILVLCL